MTIYKTRRALSLKGPKLKQHTLWLEVDELWWVVVMEGNEPTI